MVMAHHHPLSGNRRKPAKGPDPEPRQLTRSGPDAINNTKVTEPGKKRATKKPRAEPT